MNKRKSVIIQIISEEETYIAKYKISEYRKYSKFSRNNQTIR